MEYWPSTSASEGFSIWRFMEGAQSGEDMLAEFGPVFAQKPAVPRLTQEIIVGFLARREVEDA